MVNEAADEYDTKLTDLKSKLERLEKKYGLPSGWPEIRSLAYIKKKPSDIIKQHPDPPSPVSLTNKGSLLTGKLS
jgi:hypothetical protein